MSTTEQTIAALVEIGGQNLSLPQQIAATAQTKLTQMATAYQNILGSQSTMFWVDNVTGSDAAAGTLQAPFKTIGKALSLTPRGGYCHVLLKANYVMDQSILVDGKVLFVGSATGGKPSITFNRFVDLASTPNLRGAYGFVQRGLAHISFSSLTINVPVLDSNFVALSPQISGLVNINYVDWSPLSLTVADCEIVIPATPFCAIVGGQCIASLTWSNNTLTGAVSSPLGRIFHDQTNTAGVATTSLPWLRTNLANA